MFNPSDSSWDEKLKPKGVPDGEYVVFIADAWPDNAASGTPFVEFEFVIHDPRSTHKGRTIRYQRIYTSEKSLPRFVRLCRAAGVAKAFDLADQASVRAVLVDRVLRIALKSKESTYKGKTELRQELDNFRPLTAEDAEALREAYDGDLVPPLAEGADDPLALGGEGAAPSLDDDDGIPF
jgi:hypothetical protein